LIAAKRKSKEARGMKVQYQFCTETVEIEVDDKWGAVVLDLDRQEHNTNQTETRRHCSLEAYNLDDALLPSNEDVAGMVEGSDAIDTILKSLTQEQREMVRAICLDGMTEAEYGRLVGMSQAAISQKMRTAKKKIKKFFQTLIFSLLP
jgi:RNA polymerase sigma factor (sigma-70 family)